MNKAEICTIATKNFQSIRDVRLGIYTGPHQRTNCRLIPLNRSLISLLLRLKKGVGHAQIFGNGCWLAVSHLKTLQYFSKISSLSKRDIFSNFNIYLHILIVRYFSQICLHKARKKEKLSSLESFAKSLKQRTSKKNNNKAIANYV